MRTSQYKEIIRKHTYYACADCSEFGDGNCHPINEMHITIEGRLICTNCLDENEYDVGQTFRLDEFT